MIKRLKKIARRLRNKQKEKSILKRFMTSEFEKINTAEVIFFFPFYHIGGAEKIHLQIAEALSNRKIYIFFTGKSQNQVLLSNFKNAGPCYNVFSFVKGNEELKKQFKEFLINTINTNKNLQSIFGCNSFYYYDLIPFLHSQIKKIDLIHAFSAPDYGIEDYSENRIKDLDKRVVINKRTYNDLVRQYKELKLPAIVKDRITIIENGIVNNAPNEVDVSVKNPLSIGFIGRWSPEKRPDLFLNSAQKVKKISPNTKFLMAGTLMQPHKKTIENKGVTLVGELKETKALSDFYQAIDVLVITSYREGFPLVIIEAMQHGVPVISTDVGSIAEHIINKNTGYVIQNFEDEQKISEAIASKILELENDTEILRQLKLNVVAHAKNNFSITTFNQSYNALLVSN